MVTQLQPNRRGKHPEELWRNMKERPWVPEWSRGTETPTSLGGSCPALNYSSEQNKLLSYLGLWILRVSLLQQISLLPPIPTYTGSFMCFLSPKPHTHLQKVMVSLCRWENKGSWICRLDQRITGSYVTELIFLPRPHLLKPQLP